MSGVHALHHEGKISPVSEGVGCTPQGKQRAKLFLQSSELGLTQPLTRWRERGWKSSNSDEGTYTVVLFIYVLCGARPPPFTLLAITYKIVVYVPYFISTPIYSLWSRPRLRIPQRNIPDI